jgi:NAD(P)-dependent dehydrogenase (short-subunit alcohol dehydrogenase family)
MSHDELIASPPLGCAIVTGGAAGLGAATVERLHSDGMPVLICDIDAARGAEFYAMSVGYAS